MGDILDVTLSPTDKNGTTTLSNGNLTVTMTTATTGNIRATHGKTTGKWYWEIKYTGHDWFFIGIANMNYPIASPDYYGTSGNALNIRAIYAATGAKFPENVAYSSRPAAGDVIGIALNLDEGKLEFYINGKSQGVSHTNILSMGEVYPFIKSQSTTSKVITVNFGATPFDYDIPYGFYSYDGRQSKWHNKFLISSEDKYYSVSTLKYSDNTVIPKMTSNTAPSGIASASNTNSPSFPYRAFDGDIGGTWYATASFPITLQYEFTQSRVIGKYSLLGYTAENNSKDWTFEGSNDGVNWTVLDEQENQTNWTVGEVRNFSFKNTASFKIYRINITSNNGGSLIQVAELLMYEILESPRVKSLDSLSESNFLIHGKDKNGEIDMHLMLKHRSYQSTGSNILGSGKVFKQKIDTTKIPIKKASIT